MKLTKLDPQAASIMVNRYSLRDETGQLVESPSEIFLRTARVVAEAENNYRNGFGVMEAKEKFFELMYEKRFIPNGRTMANAGTKYGQLANCFVMPIEDDLGRGADSIFSVLRKAILTLQTGGGVGFSFGAIRPKGASIGSGRGKATGAVSFIKVFDTAFWVIGQGGGRRSAAMAVLPVWHPDIYEFIKAKGDEGVISNFNISVAITDEFMKAVKKDEDFALRHPENGHLWKMVPASQLFEEIVKQAHNNGEPGVLFIDAAERDNPVPELYKIEATNPCFVGETRIPTSKGLIRIKDLTEGDSLLNISVDKTVLGENKGCLQVEVKKAFLTKKADKVYKLITKRGYEIAVTSNHKFFQGKRGYIELKDLKVGDEINIQSGEGSWSKDGEIKFDLLKEVDRADVKTKLVNRYNNIPKKWSREIGVALGWIVGDGWVTWKSNSPLGFVFGKTKGGKEGLELIRKYLRNWFTEGNLTERDRVYQLTLGKTPAKFFESLGVSDVRACDKHVPESIYSAPREAVVGFLQGLFSSDGTVQISKEKGYCSVRLSSSSTELLKGVQLLLLNFGILSNLLKRRGREEKLMPNGKGGNTLYQTSPQYELIIGSTSREIFLDKIGFAINYKQEKLREFSTNLSRGSYKQKYVDVVKEISYSGTESVYDITEPKTHSLIGNGFVTHNCGEQWLGKYENCCLGSVNLREHVRKTQKSKLKNQNHNSKLQTYEVDWEKLKETVHLGVRFLDNVIDANKYVTAVPELEEAAHKIRRIGLSVMGLSDMMFQLGVRYGGSKGLELTSQVAEFIRYESMSASKELAKHRGSFPAINESIYAKSNFSFELKKPVAKHISDFGRPRLDWKTLIEEIKKFGIRNGAQTTVAPTGSIATIMGLEGYGCEPVFALSYVRHTREGAEHEGKEWRDIYYESGLFEKRLIDEGIQKLERRKIYELVRKNNGSCQGIKEVPKEIQNVFVTAADLNVEEHVKMQAAMQRHVDNSISKTVNFPATATLKEVAKAYMQGWELGLKGMTVYVEGSRKQVVLESKGPFEANGEKKISVEELCPECGGPLRTEEGCVTCPSCAYSRCDK